VLKTRPALVNQAERFEIVRVNDQETHR
jgi:hypothetical protein